MNWVVDLFRPRRRDPLAGVVQRVCAPATPRQRLANLDEPKVIQTLGDFEVIAYPDGTAAVRFETACECIVNVHCPHRSAACYLATALNMCVVSSNVDVGLDRAFE